MDKLLSLIASRVAVAVSAFAVAVAGLAGVAPTQQVSQPTFGAVIPTIVALYEDTLQDRVTSTDTTMTLVRGTDAQGNSISGFYGFIVDEGTSAQEFVTCTAAGTALTACTRGISVEDGKTSVTALKFSHRRGASIKVTNYPQLGVLSRVLNGQESVPNRLYYEGHPSFVGTVASTSLVDRKYVDDTALSGAPNADTTTKGVVEQATVTETNNGNGTGGTGARLFVGPSEIASSSWFARIPSANQFAGLSGLLASPSSSNKFLTQKAFTVSNQWLTGNASASGDLLVRSTTGFIRLASAGSAISNFALIASNSASTNMAWESVFRNVFISSGGNNAVIPANATLAEVALCHGGGGGNDFCATLILHSLGKTSSLIREMTSGPNNCELDASWGASTVTYSSGGTGCGTASASGTVYFYK